MKRAKRSAKGGPTGETGFPREASEAKRLKRYCGGPLPSVTVTVWPTPAWSVNATVTFAPGFSFRMIDDTTLGEEIVRPLIAVITSPVTSPADAAGPPSTTPAIRAPAVGVPYPSPG